MNGRSPSDPPPRAAARAVSAAAFRIVRTAPVSLADLPWSTFWTGFVPVLALTEILTIASNGMMGIDPFLKIVTFLASGWIALRPARFTIATHTRSVPTPPEHQLRDAACSNGSIRADAGSPTLTIEPHLRTVFAVRRMRPSESRGCTLASRDDEPRPTRRKPARKSASRA